MTSQPGKRQEINEDSQTNAPKRRSSRESQAQIADLAIKLFTENPAAFWNSVPELANAIERHLQASSRVRPRTPVFEGYMTEREREFKLTALLGMIAQYQATGTLESTDARKALAYAAALREYAEPYKGTLLEMVERILGLQSGSPEPVKVTFVKGKSEHHTFELARGVTLSLAWDGEVIAIGFDPKEFERRRNALAFVGSAADSQPDVAKNHDAYLWAATDGQ